MVQEEGERGQLAQPRAGVVDVSMGSGVDARPGSPSLSHAVTAFGACSGTRHGHGHGSPSLPRPLLTVSAAHVLRADLSVASPSISPSSADAFLVDSGATTRCPEQATYHLEHVLSASVCVTSSVLCNVDQDSPERSRDVTGRVMVRSQCAHTPEDNLHRSDRQDIGGEC